MSQVAVFAGTFDPPTIGHFDLIQRACHLFDRLIVGLPINPAKTPLLSQEERVYFLKKLCAFSPKIEVVAFEGLSVDLAKEKNAAVLVRGLRAFSDFEHEFRMALTNRKLTGIETVFLMTDEKFACVSSSLIKELSRFKAPLGEFLPPTIGMELESAIRKKSPVI